MKLNHTICLCYFPHCFSPSPLSILPLPTLYPHLLTIPLPHCLLSHCSSFLPPFNLLSLPLTLLPLPSSRTPQAANSSSQILTAEQLVEANKLAKVCNSPSNLVLFLRLFLFLSPSFCLSFCRSVCQSLSLSVSMTLSNSLSVVLSVCHYLYLSLCHYVSLSLSICI